MKDGNAGKRTFTKSRLIKELSWTCGIPQTKVAAIMDNLVEIARREARGTFVLPGLCKLEVVRRKPRKVRNPRTGETFMLPEREALRITAPRSLKLAFAKAVEPEAALAAPEPQKQAEQPAAEQAPATPAAEQQPAAEPVAPAAPEPQKPAEQPAAEPTPAAPAAEQQPAAAAEPPVAPDALISFRCPRCHQEVEATGDMVGFETECPTCGNPITVPARSEPGTLHSGGAQSEEDAGAAVRHAPTVTAHEAESMSPEKLKGLTIRIDVDALGMGGQQKQTEEDAPSEQMISFVCQACKQEIEASRDMVGETTACPNCGAPLVVPAESTSDTLHASPDADPKTLQAMKGRTMRIDMGDDF